MSAQLPAALAHRGQRVLVVDLDPQANASRRLGFRWSAAAPVAWTGGWGIGRSRARCLTLPKPGRAANYDSVPGFQQHLSMGWGTSTDPGYPAAAFLTDTCAGPGLADDARPEQAARLVCVRQRLHDAAELGGVSHACLP